METKQFILFYLVSIATILGSGILGLPIAVAYSGLFPFFVTFTLNFVAQILLVNFVLELIQVAHVVKSDETTG